MVLVALRAMLRGSAGCDGSMELTFVVHVVLPALAYQAVSNMAVGCSRLRRSVMDLWGLVATVVLGCGAWSL
jgi:hypothetical protein